MARVFLSSLYEAREARRKATRHHSYYCEKNAKEILPILDKLLTNPTFNARWNFQDFRCTKPAVLKLRLYHGINYIIDNLDPNEDYVKLRANLIFSQDDLGIKTRRVASLGQVVYTEDTDEVHKSENPWRMELVSFIEDSDKRRLIIDSGISLTREDIQYIELTLHDATELTGDEFVHIIDHNSIKILRKDKEDHGILQSDGGDSNPGS